MDGLRGDLTKSRKSEKDKYHMISHKQSLKKKWRKWTYLQNRRSSLVVQQVPSSTAEAVAQVMTVVPILSLAQELPHVTAVPPQTKQTKKHPPKRLIDIENQLMVTKG